MEYHLIQYGCDNCGALTEVLDSDQQLPKGWSYVGELMENLYCPECSKRKKQKIYDDKKR